MPRNTREYLLRYADQATNDLERSLERIGKIADTYRETHPINAQAFEQLGIIIAQAHEFLITLRDNNM